MRCEGTRRKTNRETRYQRGFGWIFHKSGDSMPARLLLRNSAANRVPDEPSAAFSDRYAQNLRHPVVDGVHSIDFAADRRSIFN